VILAWLPDPRQLPRNPEAYFWHNAQRLIIVDPGTALLTFSPKTNLDNFRGTSGGNQDKNYVLAVTRDGFWGVLDMSNGLLFIDESDLRAMAKEEAGSSSPQFGMWATSAANFYTEVSNRKVLLGLTRGEVFRIISDDGNNTVIDFGGSVPSVMGKQSVLRKEYKDIDAGLTKFTIPDTEGSFTAIQVSDDLVPDRDLDAWRNERGDYQDIFSDTFGDLRVSLRGSTAKLVPTAICPGSRKSPPILTLAHTQARLLVSLRKRVLRRRPLCLRSSTLWTTRTHPGKQHSSLASQRHASFSRTL
jgi:hypothetical protein